MFPSFRPQSSVLHGERTTVKILTMVLLLSTPHCRDVVSYCFNQVGPSSTYWKGHSLSFSPPQIPLSLLARGLYLPLSLPKFSVHKKKISSCCLFPTAPFPILEVFSLSSSLFHSSLRCTIKVSFGLSLALSSPQFSLSHIKRLLVYLNCLPKLGTFSLAI